MLNCGVQCSVKLCTVVLRIVKYNEVFIREDIKGIFVYIVQEGGGI